MNVTEANRHIETPATNAGETNPVHRIKSAAAYVGCHEKTLLRALRRKELVGYQRGGANCVWRIYQADLDAWIRGERPKRRTA